MITLKKYLVKPVGSKVSYVAVSKEVANSPSKLRKLRASKTFRSYKCVTASTPRAAINKIIKPKRKR